MSVELIIDCADATSQSPYIYEQRAPSDCPEEAEFCCPYDKSHFTSVLVSSENEAFVNEYGDYISLSQ